MMKLYAYDPKSKGEEKQTKLIYISRMIYVTKLA